MEGDIMKIFAIACALTCLAAVQPATAAKTGGATHPVAAQPATLGPAHQTGQPNQSCGSAAAPLTPGNAAAAPGSAFNPNGKAGTVYAGQQPQNSRNSASVSQYDVACSKQK
jgi:hypothetical protein